MIWLMSEPSVSYLRLTEGSENVPYGGEISNEKRTWVSLFFMGNGASSPKAKKV